MSFQTSALIVTWAALLLLAFVVAGLVRQVHALSGGTRPVPAGSRPGDRADLAPLGVSAPAVLLFLRSTCHTCTEAVAETVDAVGERLTVVALYESSAAEVPPGVLARADQGHLFAPYGALATPFAVLVGEDGRITAAAPVGSRAAVRQLLAPAMEVR
ncbi:hypothetical protein BLA60_37410 [Actinophytocola xinjiangensis]|jgi:hypothetical protein|uniref:Thioredoxin domain-containing protein n=1 Tax=Actinophytocola xinjiangensis TaxID=485602 RepID=A0A7Z1AU59_9PSEU|nr:hypothetical protein [Actinophytocola xinjiangensis]OLF05195.1 hypothetical protein BLA60_37410 [Actinophytocola xinjiangensis]